MKQGVCGGFSREHSRYALPCSCTSYAKLTLQQPSLVVC